MSDNQAVDSETRIVSAARVVNRPLWKAARCLLLILLLAACGRNEEKPAPTAETAVEPATVATEPAEPETELEADAPVESPLPAPTPTNVDAAAYPPPEATAPATVTVDANGNTAVFTPLEVDEGLKCDIESHIDLAGYPNLEQIMGCPTGEASTDPVAINEFGEGPDFNRFMLWFSTDRQIYVLFPDGAWRSYEDTWEEGDPTFSCNPLEDEPDSPPLPRRGFGKLWCSDPELQEVLGTVPREERLCQHSVVQPFADGRLLACFEDATIRYFRLLDDNTWDVVVQ